jgi:hypothetical protein
LDEDRGLRKKIVGRIKKHFQNVFSDLWKLSILNVWIKICKNSEIDQIFTEFLGSRGWPLSLIPVKSCRHTYFKPKIQLLHLVKQFFTFLCSSTNFCFFSWWWIFQRHSCNWIFNYTDIL